jgi:uncharacterized protein (DUF697 family)
VALAFYNHLIQQMQIQENIPQESALAALSVCLLAAFCDGVKKDAEHEEIRRLVDDLGAIDSSALTRRILLGKVSLNDVVPQLTAHSERMLAYEMALGVCEADGELSAVEKNFLGELRAKLGLDEGEAAAVERDVTSLVLSPIPQPEQNANPVPDNNGMILNYSILNAALELLPESLASMAIIPLQMKMVYRIGKSRGVELDRSRIKEFLAVAGLGVGSQMIEGFARKFMRGLGRKVGGKMTGHAGDQLAGSAMSFASTYAIGHLADRYHSGGQKLDAASAKALFASLQQQARDIHAKFIPAIQEKSKSIQPNSILQMVSGFSPV